MDENQEDQSESTSTNGASKEDFLFFKGLFENIAGDLRDVKGRRKQARARAESVGLNVDMLDRVIKDQDNGGEVTLDELREYKRYAEWLDMPVGTQLSFLDSPKRRKQKEDDREKAARVGYSHGLAGAARDEQAYPPLTEIGMAYADAYDRGQDELKERFVAYNNQVDEPKKRGRPRNRNGGADAENPGA